MKKIAEGVATLASSVYPKRIIVRLSDFKSNERLGGRCWEFVCFGWAGGGWFYCLELGRSLVALIYVGLLAKTLCLQKTDLN